MADRSRIKRRNNVAEEMGDGSRIKGGIMLPKKWLDGSRIKRRNNIAEEMA